MASLKHEQHFTLDAGFWRATAVMAVISALLMWGVVAYPIDRILPEASSASLPIDFIYRFMGFFGVPIMVFVNGYIIYFAIRYRRRPDEPMESVGSPIHDHRILENTWTIVPSILMVVLGVISYLVMPQYYLRGKDSAATIEAIGRADPWYFEFRYPGIQASVRDELHLPLGVPVTIDLTSAEADESKAVLHSFWVPAFRVKQDMIPGMIVPIHFTPREIGKFPLICAEFCGVGHGRMWGTVVVEPRPDFDKWFAMEQHVKPTTTAAINLASGNAQNGQALFNQKCSVCHNAAPFDQRKVGPGLADIFNDPKHPNLVDNKPANPQDVEEILVKGFQGDMGTMPNEQANGLKPQDIADLIAYLKTLK